MKKHLIKVGIENCMGCHGKFEYDKTETVYSANDQSPVGVVCKKCSKTPHAWNGSRTNGKLYEGK